MGWFFCYRCHSWCKAYAPHWLTPCECRRCFGRHGCFFLSWWRTSYSGRSVALAALAVIGYLFHRGGMPNLAAIGISLLLLLAVYVFGQALFVGLAWLRVGLGERRCKKNARKYHERRRKAHEKCEQEYRRAIAAIEEYQRAGRSDAIARGLKYCSICGLYVKTVKGVVNIYTGAVGDCCARCGRAHCLEYPEKL